MRTLILINISYSWNCVFFSILSAYNYLVRTGKAEIVLSEINGYPSGFIYSLHRILLAINY